MVFLRTMIYGFFFKFKKNYDIASCQDMRKDEIVSCSIHNRFEHMVLNLLVKILGVIKYIYRVLNGLVLAARFIFIARHKNGNREIFQRVRWKCSRTIILRCWPDAVAHLVGRTKTRTTQSGGNP